MNQAEPLISVVRQKVLSALQAMGAGDGCCSESILVRDRIIVGRRFCLGGFMAVWMTGESQISIFNEAGDLIDTQSVDDDVEQLRKAA